MQSKRSQSEAGPNKYCTFTPLFYHTHKSSTKLIEMAVIALEEMEFYAYHGYYAQENKFGGYYLVDVYLNTNFETAAQHDQLSGTINYEVVYEICKNEMLESSNLIEHVALRMLDKIAENFTEVKKIKVRVSKLNPPLPGKLKRTFVEIEKNFEEVEKML